MQQVDAARANDAQTLAQLPVTDNNGRMLCDADGVSLALHALYYGHRDLAIQIAARCHTIDMFTAAALNDVAQLTQQITHQPDGIHVWSGDGFQALGLACFFGATEAVQCCIAHGADVNSASRNAFMVAPIHSATAANSIAITSMLLDAGADANLRQQGGFCALHNAAQHSNRAMCELLIAHGANIHLTTDDGQTAAMFANSHNHAHLGDILA